MRTASATVRDVNGDLAPRALRYLPVVDLATQGLHGFEMVTAESIEHRLEASLRAAAAWRATSPTGPTVMVDVAPDELRPATADLIATLLDAYQLRPEVLILRVPTYSLDVAVPILDRLVDRGVVVAVRDPDLRGAELGLLAGAPIDLIELPAALVDHIDRDEAAFQRIARRISLAHAHDWLTLARDLDRLTQVTALQRLGCELASGPAVGPLLGRFDADRVVARYFPGGIARPRQLAS